MSADGGAVPWRATTVYMHPRDFWGRGKKVAWSQVRTKVPSQVRPFTCIPEFSEKGGPYLRCANMIGYLGTEDSSMVDTTRVQCHRCC